MKSNVVESKIQVPRVPQNFIIRERLLKQFDDEDSKLFILHATVGYGKTVLLTHLAACTNADVAWYHLSETDNDIITFMQYLIKSVGKVFEAISFDITSYKNLEQDEILLKNMVYDFLVQITKAQKDKHRPTYIVMDDFQVINNEKINTIIEMFLTNAETDIKFVIATKGCIPAFWGKFYLQGAAKMITQEQLSFSMDEIRRMLMGLVGNKEDIEEISEELFYGVEGWPAGVMFEILYMKQSRGNFNNAICEKAAVYDYIMRELYRNLPYDIQMFLATTSVLEYLNADICNAVMKKDNSQSMLNYLVQENLLIMKVGDTDKMFRYHSLIKEFLNTMVQGQRKKEIMEIASNFYLHTENKEQAVEYAMGSGNIELMQYAMGTIGLKLVQQGKLSTMERWISWLSKRTTELTEKSILIYSAYYHKTGNKIKVGKYDERVENIIAELPKIEKEKYLCLVQPNIVAVNKATHKNYFIKVNCIGGFQVCIPNANKEIKWRTKKAQELFALLFHLGGEAVTKEKILVELWPDTSEKSATSLLHTALYSVRKELSQNDMDNLICYHERKYSLNMSHISSDLQELLGVYSKIKENVAMGESVQSIVQMYKGSYMESIEHNFCVTQRINLERLFLKLCEILATQKITERDFDNAIICLNKALSINPFEEKFYLLLIQCYGQLGDIKNAKYQFKNMKQMLKDELDIEPSEEVLTIIKTCFDEAIQRRSVS